jgi:hypothetical protein
MFQPEMLDQLGPGQPDRAPWTNELPGFLGGESFTRNWFLLDHG